MYTITISQMNLPLPDIDERRLVLYVLAQLSYPIRLDALAELLAFEHKMTYFDVARTVTSLLNRKHIAEERNALDGGALGFVITDKGRRNVKALEDDIPRSQRVKADDAAGIVARRQDIAALTKQIRDVHAATEPKAKS